MYQGASNEHAHRRRTRRNHHLRLYLPGDVPMIDAHCRADDFRRKLVGLVGRASARHYAVDPCELAGFVQLLNRNTGRILWLRVKGRPVFRWTCPTAYAVARLACSPDDVRQLRNEALALH